MCFHLSVWSDTGYQLSVWPDRRQLLTRGAPAGRHGLERPCGIAFVAGRTPTSVPTQPPIQHAVARAEPRHHLYSSSVRPSLSNPPQTTSPNPCLRSFHSQLVEKHADLPKSAHVALLPGREAGVVGHVDERAQLVGGAAAGVDGGSVHVRLAEDDHAQVRVHVQSA